MKITHKSIVALFLGLGFEPASKWDAARCQKKLGQLCEIINDPKQVSVDMLDSAAEKQLFNEIKTAHNKGKELIVVADEASEEAPAKPAKKAAPVLPDEDETPAPAAKPAKKKAAAPAATEEETPAPAKKKAAKPAKSDGKAERDEFGSIVGSSNAKVNEVLSKKALTFTQIVEKSGLSRATVRYAHLDKLVADGHAKKVEVDGTAAWALA